MRRNRWFVITRVAETGVAEQGLAVELIADRRAHAAALMDFRQAMAKVGRNGIKTEFAVEKANATTPRRDPTADTS